MTKKRRSLSEPTKTIELLKTQIEAATDADSSVLLELIDAAQMLLDEGVTLRAESVRLLQRLLLQGMTRKSMPSWLPKS